MVHRIPKEYQQELLNLPSQWTSSQGWKWKESCTPHATFDENTMFGSAQCSSKGQAVTGTKAHFFAEKLCISCDVQRASSINSTQPPPILVLQVPLVVCAPSSPRESWITLIEKLMNLEEHLNLGRSLLNYTDVPGKYTKYLDTEISEFLSQFESILPPKDERFCQPPLEWTESKKAFLQSVQIWYTKLSKFLLEYQNLLRNNEERKSNLCIEAIKTQKKCQQKA
ncbi:hypothetical protein GcC1_099009 [Golovinomyces cichoracearum]|uniref:Uncharacterized protein n=1 Tax=Golovinomyces cichoracearum TaxID=62708 RepID=A0A420IAB9_9PEZI|nr:hypothetical protein GcC1_099009 [Golovinomyces cichoracearum]